MSPEPNPVQEEEIDNDPNGGDIEEVDMDMDDVLDAWLPLRG